MKTHIYVILRHDRFHDVDRPISVRVSGTKAYSNEEDAEKERARLQSLKPMEDCEYFVVLARLVGKQGDDVDKGGDE